MSARVTLARSTFRATSNAVKATEVTGLGQNLRDAISRNEAFERAFQLDEEKVYSGFRRGPEAKDKKAAPIILQSSRASSPVRAARYGLVSAILDAYNTHHNLVLRPDDLWQAILTQFSFYVNDNAEELRDCFVDFKGKKTLVITMGGSLHTADYESFANRMVDEQISANIKDPKVTEWLLPNFTTTSSTDRVAASVTIMSTLQSYFEFVCCLCCGIPEVTLEGTPDDWRALRQKIDCLPNYDIKGKDQVMAKWHKLLGGVVDQFIAASEGKPDLDFWDKICCHRGGGSGPSYISGWVTVFACFTGKGKWQGDVRDYRYDNWGNKEHPEYPMIDTGYIPIGAVSVPVLVDDNGIQYATQMLAGQFAYAVTGEGSDTIQPRNDWCIAYEGEPKDNPKAYVHGEIHPAAPRAK